MSDALNTLLKNKFEMKTFTHAPIPDDQIPEVFTETINRKRFYVTPDGNKYPSITTVLSGRAKEGINAWRKRVGEAVANNIMRTAAKRGTAVHELCENYLNNEELKNTISRYIKHNKNLQDHIDYLTVHMFNCSNAGTTNYMIMKLSIYIYTP